ncbi:branched-chain amino acid ABC transporter permease [Alcaligenaceae bacterium]|nr:branched-chain amino acid ABC transporter permease [Alcaligenaceae bacterium]
MSTFVIGLSISMVLFLLASGLTLIFGLLKIINFAHGALYMLGAYLAYQISVMLGFWWALAGVPLVLALVGVLIERLTLRPIYSAPHALQLVVTFGLILVLEEVVRVVWGLSGKNIAVPALLSGSIELFSTELSRYRLFVVVVGATAAALLLFVVERTKLGLLVRACSANSMMAATLGIRVDRARALVFAIGAALAGFAGVITGPMLPIQLQMGNSIILDCFIVVIIGGLGNIRGAVIGALLIGMTRAYGQQYLSEWIDLIVYTVLISTLLLRPQGLFSKRERLA